MFTGLVRDIGVIERVVRRGDGATITLSTAVAGQLEVGDSLAVNGVCLTATEVRAASGTARGRVSATMVAETLRRSNLGELRAGRRVNLEPALCAGQPLGGHIVQGHVDGVGRLARRVTRDRGCELSIVCPEDLLRYVVEKGSIAVDGVSLTVAGVSHDAFSVALVPHTMELTTLGDVSVGSRLNLEVDILAKYVERLVQPGLLGRIAGAGTAGEDAAGRGERTSSLKDCDS